MQPPSTPAIDLNAAAGSAALPKSSRVKLGAMLYGDTTAHLHFRIEMAAGLDATTVATATCSLGHLGSEELRLPSEQPGTPYIYWLFTDAAGADLAGVNAGNALQIYAVND